MNLTALFIHRPVATSLCAIAVALAGTVAYCQLPVSSLPEVDFPTISISAELPGASAETMAATVATPLERALGRIAGITELTSQSGMGSSQISVQFDLDRDINAATRDVQAAINAASSLLPAELPSPPRYRRENPGDSPIIVLTLTSDSLDLGRIYDLAATVLAQKIAQIAGVGQVDIRGASLPAVRIGLNPDVLAAYGIGMEDVRRAIVQNNANRPKGAVEYLSSRWQIQANDQLLGAKDYQELIIANRNGTAIRLAELADVRDSVENLSNAGVKDGKPAVLLVVKKQSKANVIETVDAIKAALPQLRASIPDSITLQMASDRSLTIRASLREVQRTLLFAVALVTLVVFLFLRNLHATLIPLLAVPVSLLGACGIMYFGGFSLNNLTLMALTIATGFVVDDAIVVLENASQHIEKGMAPLQAALRTGREVGFTVLAMNLSLVAAFIPILLMSGMVGRLFREFAVTLAAVVVVSLLVSLSLTPMLCARWLRRAPPQPAHGRLYDGFERAFASVQADYRRSLAWALRHQRIMLILLVVTLGLNVQLYRAIDKGFFPTQDGGRLMGFVQADQAVSFPAMQKIFFDFADRIRQDPAVVNVNGFFSSQRSLNTAMLFIDLKEHEQRGSIDEILARFRKNMARIPGAVLRVFPAQELRIGARSSPGLFEFTLLSSDLELLRLWTPKIQQALAGLSELKDVSTDQQDKGQRIGLSIDRELAVRYGVTPALIDATLNDAFGQRPVSVIYDDINQYKVVLELAEDYLRSPEALQRLRISVPGAAGTAPPKQVPLGSVAKQAPGSTVLTVNHQAQFAASTLSFNLNQNVALSTAAQAIQAAMRDIGVPIGIQGRFQGAAKVFEESLRNQPWLILTSVIAIYIVLGMLYESLIHPLTILSTLPSAGVGALLALMSFGGQLSIIALIGIILLTGIVMKNAIMMIDRAIQFEREQSLPAQEAIFQACLHRFRPILMTTLAAFFGALPLALQGGYGAELRQPLGITIIGGLIFSQILTLYTTPVVYLYLDGFRRRCLALWGRRTAMPQREGA